MTEPTEAMVEAAVKPAVQRMGWISPEERQDAIQGFRDAIAAASPEWLLRAALTEEELHALDDIPKELGWELEEFSEAEQAAWAKLSRALRGGEET